MVLVRRAGGFLVRVSENRFGYTLSYRVEDRCRHYIVEQDTRGHYALVGVAKVRFPVCVYAWRLHRDSLASDLQQHQRAHQLLPAKPNQR